MTSLTSHRPKSRFLLSFTAILCACAIEPAAASDEKANPAPAFQLPEKIEYLLEDHCWKCHDYGTQKGDISLDGLADMENPKRLDLLNRMQEQVYFQHMPPKKEEQPSEEDRKELLGFISGELAKYEASTLEGKLQKPEYGNYVDHEKLFSGEYKDIPGFTYDRRWLISEYIFNAKFQRMLENETGMKYYKQSVKVLGGTSIANLGLANPFLLPTNSGVRYYANEDLTGGHLSSMLTNAQKTSEYITGYLVARNKNFLPAINEIMALDDQQAALLASRRKFLETSIARLCEEIYGSKNESLLPTFVPVELKPIEALAEGETYKKAPFGVSSKLLDRLGGSDTLNQLLLDPEHRKKSDDELRVLCEKTWFNLGHFERTIQTRMAILRDYMPELRERVTKENGNKIKPLVYKPLEGPEMETIKAAILKHRKQGDFYSAIIEKCMADWEKGFEQDLIAAGPPSEELLSKLIGQLSQQILERPPTTTESAEYLEVSKTYITKLGKLKAIQKLIQTFILSSEFAYRSELGSGEADKHGRRMLSPRDASYAIAYALTDQSPDEELRKAAEEGRLSTREDYRREVQRILARRDLYYMIDPILGSNYWDNKTNTAIRKLRFFREFFGYPKALTIFKDEKRFGGDRLTEATNRLVNEADRLVEYILEKDKDVFGELLGTEEFFVFHDGDNERMTETSERIKSIYAYFKDLDWKNFKNEDLTKHAEFLRKVNMRMVNPDNLAARNRQGSTLQLFKKSMETITARLDKGQKDAAPFDMYRGYGSDFMQGENVAKFWGYRKDNWDWSAVQPAKVPNRKGILTHPAWLVAFAFNTETDPVHRGKFVREKLLADTIPDVPITVDAQIPEDHNKTLRDRLAMATENKSCWHCHVKMNPLGNTFEMYDDFGRFRTEEFLEYPEHVIEKKPEKPSLNHLLDIRDIYKALPVDPSGHLAGTGDTALDGDLKSSIDLADRLSKSRVVRQSFIRHAFRYFMGRNEFLSDSKTLIDAEQAYVSNGGSFDAVIVSLLTSDSFIYRKTTKN